MDWEYSMKIKDLEMIKTSAHFFEYKLPFVYAFFIYIILVIVIISILWISFTKMDQTVKGSGVLRLKTNTSIGKIAYSGTIKSKNFISGSIIKKDDVLLIMDTADIQEDKINTENEIKRLKDSLNIMMLFEKAVQADKNNIISTEVVAFAKAEVYFLHKEKLKILYEQAKEEYLHEKELPASMRTKKSLISLLNKFKIAELDYRTFASQEIINIQNEKILLTQKLEAANKSLIRLLKQINESKISAPFDGIVEELIKVNQGDYIFSGAEILRVIPNNLQELKAEIAVSDKDIAELKIGLDVNLTLPSLPPSEYGILKGIITNISNDSLNNQKNSSFFLIDVDLISYSLKNNKNEEVKLKPGMTAEARIIIRTKPVIQFILEKLDFIR